MKKNFYIFFIISVITSCNQSTSINNNEKTDSVEINISFDTLKIIPIDSLVDQKIVSNDSIIFFEESLFADLELDFKEISEKDYIQFEKQYKTVCTLDSGDNIRGSFIYGSGIYSDLECDGISVCEKYLIEKATNKRLFLNTSFDRVVTGVFVGPSCDKMIFYSTYDGPDYNNYYDHRAEFFIMSVNTNNGLNGIKPFYKYYTNDWSIEDLCWVNDKSIALKIYEENRWGDGSRVKYKYFKTDIK